MPTDALAQKPKKKKRVRRGWEKDTELIDWGAEVRRDSAGNVIYKDTLKLIENALKDAGEKLLPTKQDDDDLVIDEGKKVDEEKENEEEEENTPGLEPFVTGLLQECYKHMGKRYSYGSGGPATFDCSGLTSYCFSKMGITLPHSSRSQYDYGTRISKISDVIIGDLVFFKGRSTSSAINHVGIVTEVNENGKDFKFIHAASTGVIISSYSEDYYRIRYVGATRVRPKE